MTIRGDAAWYRMSMFCMLEYSVGCDLDNDMEGFFLFCFLLFCFLESTRY